MTQPILSRPVPASIECQSAIDKDLVRTYSGDLDAFYRVRAAIVATPAVGGEASIPTYGNLPWDQLGRDVMEANMGTRCDFEFDPKFYPGHQSLSTNFNSLARIVDKYRVAAPPASPLREREAVRAAEMHASGRTKAGNDISGI